MPFLLYKEQQLKTITDSEQNILFASCHTAKSDYLKWHSSQPSSTMECLNQKYLSKPCRTQRLGFSEGRPVTLKLHYCTSGRLFFPSFQLFDYFMYHLLSLTLGIGYYVGCVRLASKPTKGWKICWSHSSFMAAKVKCDKSCVHSAELKVRMETGPAFLPLLRAPYPVRFLQGTTILLYVAFPLEDKAQRFHCFHVCKHTTIPIK